MLCLWYVAVTLRSMTVGGRKIGGGGQTTNLNNFINYNENAYSRNS